jgi:hypothetical protein
MDEIWKTITYSPNYVVSNMGNIKNTKTNKQITINYDRLKKDNKRARPGLSHNGKLKQYYLHRIVAEHFIDNPGNFPEVNHIDGDYYNNKAVNLEWISKLDNMKHASDNKLMKRYTRKVIITNKETGEEKTFDKVIDCAKYLECLSGQISLTCRGKRVDKLYDMKYECKERTVDENENIIWKEYPECKKYLVSTTGEIQNKKTGRLMMGSKQNGYRFVNFRPGNKDTPKMNRLIHRMVAQTFLENPDNKPVVNHKDTNILNNNVDNLEWVTYKENMNTEDTIKNLKKGKNSKTIHQILIETGEIVNTFDGASECAVKCCLKICHFYNKGNVVCKNINHQKTYQNKFIFIFDEDKDKLNEYLKIAKNKDRTENQKKLCRPIIQVDKETNEIIKSFDSIYSASKELNIGHSGISQCCNHYKYTDEDRPNCYKYSKQYKGFIFKFTI